MVFGVSYLQLSEYLGKTIGTTNHFTGIAEEKAGAAIVAVTNQHKVLEIIALYFDGFQTLQKCQYFLASLEFVITTNRETCDFVRRSTTSTNRVFGVGV